MRKKRQEKFITIKDVSSEAGVSIATVSRVINNGRVRPEKKKKVLDAIKKLNYVPNTSARNLASVNQTKRVSLIIPDLSREYYIELIKGFKDILKTYAYDSIIEYYNFDKKEYESISDNFQFSSEVKAFVVLGDKVEIDNKIFINLEDKHINYLKEDSFENIAIYTKDYFIEDFLRKNILINSKSYQKGKKYKEYLAPTINESLNLYNSGITKETIYTFGNVEEISKICPNIKKINLDFYFLGVILARLAIKRLREEEITPVKFGLHDEK